MEKSVSRLVRLIERQYRSKPAVSTVPFALRMYNGPAHFFGGSSPAFTIILNTPQAVAAISTLRQEKIAEAYLDGDVDVQGDFMRLLSVRELFSDKRGLQFL